MDRLLACMLPSVMAARLPETLPLPLVRRPSPAGAELAGSVRLLLAAIALSSIAGVGGSGMASAQMSHIKVYVGPAISTHL